jgi:acetyltransferase-like isoleucine patch superfamily enzyme
MNRDQAWVHPDALIERDVQLGTGTKVWDGAHIRYGVRIGRSCIVGGKSYVAYDVRIGNFVKINASVYVCAGVTIEDFVMVSAHVVFTNDRFPRAGNSALTGLETSDVTGETSHTNVCRGATIGANATIGPGLRLGEFCMVGMGSVVTHDVAPHCLVTGNPARPAGLVCVCGQRVARLDCDGFCLEAPGETTCARCGRSYRLQTTSMRASHDPYLLS